MTKTERLTKYVIVSVLVLAACVCTFGALLVKGMNEAAEQERFDRSWQNCNALFDRMDDVLECHIANVSD